MTSNLRIGSKAFNCYIIHTEIVLHEGGSQWIVVSIWESTTYVESNRKREKRMNENYQYKLISDVIRTEVFLEGYSIGKWLIGCCVISFIPSTETQTHCCNITTQQCCFHFWYFAFPWFHSVSQDSLLLKSFNSA